MAWGIALQLIALSGVVSAASQGVPRGVAPADAALYKPGAGNTFTCRSGSPTFAYEKLNDNYCDCPDGSDEPGTAACSMLQATRFYCANKGGEGKFILSQFVDDGVCDCCDGSDENGTVPCPDTCIEEGRSKMAALKLSLADAEAGLKKRDQLRKRATAKRAEWEKRLEELEEAESRAAQEKVKAEVGKKNAEGRLERASDLVTRLEEKAVKLKEEGEKEVDDASTVDDASRGSDTSGQEVPFEDDSEVALEENETDEDRAKRIASQWIPEAGDDVDDDVGDDEEEVYDAPSTDEDDIQDSSDDAEDTPLGVFNSIKVWIEDWIAYLMGTVDVERELKLAKMRLESMEKRVKTASGEFREKERVLRDLEREMADLKVKLGHKYGEDDVYLSLSESCVETSLVDGKYTYKVCPFGNAQQFEGRRSTGLGKWEGFGEDSGEQVMRFLHGDSCWQGPQRSMEVKLRCGAEDSFDSVSEPSRCQYTGVVTTPAFCNENIVLALRKKVEQLEALISSNVAGEVSHQEL